MEGKKYVTLSSVDVMVNKACMLFTQVEMDTVPGNKGICERVSMIGAFMMSFALLFGHLHSVNYMVLQSVP